MKRTGMYFLPAAYEISDEIPDNDYISYKGKSAFYNKPLKLIKIHSGTELEIRLQNILNEKVNIFSCNGNR